MSCKNAPCASFPATTIHQMTSRSEIRVSSGIILFVLTILKIRSVCSLILANMKGGAFLIIILDLQAVLVLRNFSVSVNTDRESLYTIVLVFVRIFGAIDI